MELIHEIDKIPINMQQLPLNFCISDPGWLKFTYKETMYAYLKYVINKLTKFNECVTSNRTF